jgi:hypothetical protein
MKEPPPRTVILKKARPATKKEKAVGQAKLQADVDRKLKALEQRWEASGHTDLPVLLSALNFCPPRAYWVYAGVFNCVSEKLPRATKRDIDAMRTRLAVSLYKELRQRDPSKTKHETIEAVRAQMGEQALSVKEMENALHRSRAWPTKRPRKHPRKS